MTSKQRIDNLSPMSRFDVGWAKRLSKDDKDRLDKRIMQNSWRLERGKKDGEVVIVEGKPTIAIIEFEMRDGTTRSIYVASSKVTND